MRTRTSLVFLGMALVSAAAWAGTAFITFDGDDGSGSSLPPGVVLGSDGGGAVQLVDDRAVFSGGGEFIEFPPAWLESGNVVVEYTLEDVGAFLADPAADYVIGFAAAGDGGLWFSAIADPEASGASLVSAFDFGLGRQGATDLNDYGPADRATVRAVIQEGGAVTVYVALDEAATTSAGRAREEDFIYMGQYGWGSFKANPDYFRFQSWGKGGAIDNIMIEGASVPDFGTPPPMAAPGTGTIYLNFDGDDGTGSTLAGSIVGWSAQEDVAFTGGALEIGPNQWGGGCYLTFGMFPRGPFSMEFTIQNPAEVAAYDATWGWVLGLQKVNVPNTECLYAGGVFDGIGWEAGDTPEIAVASCGAQADSPTQVLTAAERATIKVVVDSDANTLDLYTAFDDDATTPAQRAHNLTLVASYPWGTWAYGPTLFRMVGYSVGSTGPTGRMVIDDIIIEGVGVPDFGPEPPATVDVVTVPNVVGMTQQDAEDAIVAAGLVVGTVTMQDSQTVPEGDVISTSPQAGATAQPGSAVNLVVSRGSMADRMPAAGAVALSALAGLLALGAYARRGRA